MNLSLLNGQTLAEREGFEPPVPRSTPVFKTGAIDHSATFPKTKKFHKFSLVSSFRQPDIIRYVVKLLQLHTHFRDSAYSSYLHAVPTSLHTEVTITKTMAIWSMRYNYVDPNGLEPLTLCVQSRCSSQTELWTLILFVFKLRDEPNILGQNFVMNHHFIYVQTSW